MSGGNAYTGCIGCTLSEQKMLDPASKYELAGQFDVESFDEDREKYSSFFDDNGWPLFGRFDPYALRHPITGQVWFENPRIPSEGETDQGYLYWFRIAQSYWRIDTSVLGALHLARQDCDDASEVDLSDHQFRPGRYKDGIEYGFWANTQQLTKLRPKLRSLLAVRDSGLELTEAWGEYIINSERVLASLPQMLERRAKKKAGRGHFKKSEQRKWYKFWRANCDLNLKISANAANSILLSYCWSILKNNTCPDGYDASWFGKLLGEVLVTKKGVDGTQVQVKEPIRALSNAMKRSGYRREEAENLLRAYEDERHQFPPFPSVFDLADK